MANVLARLPPMPRLQRLEARASCLSAASVDVLRRAAEQGRFAALPALVALDVRHNELAIDIAAALKLRLPAALPGLVVLI